MCAEQPRYFCWLLSSHCPAEGHAIKRMSKLMGAQICLGMAILSAVLGGGVFLLLVCSDLQFFVCGRTTAQWAVTSHTFLLESDSTQSGKHQAVHRPSKSAKKK